MYTLQHEGGWYYVYTNNSEDQVFTEQIIFQMTGLEIRGCSPNEEGMLQRDYQAIMQPDGEGMLSVMFRLNPGEIQTINVRRKFGNSFSYSMDSMEAVMTLVQPLEEYSPEYAEEAP